VKEKKVKIKMERFKYNFIINRVWTAKQKSVKSTKLIT